jgi:hypothetical protein
MHSQDRAELRKLCLEALIEFMHGTDTIDAHWNDNIKAFRQAEIECANEDPSLVIKGCVFDQPVDFTGWEFNIRIDMEDVQFRSEILFAGATICHSLNFSNCKFEGKLDFFQATINDSVRIIDSTCGELYFVGVTLNGNLHIQLSAASNAEVTFLRALVNGRVDLKGIRHVIGNNVPFHEDISIECRAGDELIFPFAHFYKNFAIVSGKSNEASDRRTTANFKGAEFCGDVLISMNALNGKWMFDRAQFKQEFVVSIPYDGNGADGSCYCLENAGNISFTFCLFEGAFFARRRIFCSGLDFSYSVFKGEVLLDEAEFKADVSFEAVVADRPIAMTKCKFARIPDFRDAKLGHPLIFNRIWPDNKRRVPSPLVVNEKTSERFDALARIAGQLGDIEWQQLHAVSRLRVEDGIIG